MGLVYNTYLDSDKIFGCKNCKTHLASHDAIISRVRFLTRNNALCFLHTFRVYFNHISGFTPPYAPWPRSMSLRMLTFR